MKKIAAFTSVLAMLTSTMFISAPAAKAQYAGFYTCEAVSPYATGLWSHNNLDYACHRAKQECAARTPYGYVCYVRRYWIN